MRLIARMLTSRSIITVCLSQRVHPVRCALLGSMQSYSQAARLKAAPQPPRTRQPVQMGACLRARATSGLVTRRMPMARPATQLLRSTMRCMASGTPGPETSQQAQQDTQPSANAPPPPSHPANGTPPTPGSSTESSFTSTPSTSNPATPSSSDSTAPSASSASSSATTPSASSDDENSSTSTPQRSPSFSFFSSLFPYFTSSAPPPPLNTQPPPPSSEELRDLEHGRGMVAAPSDAFASTDEERAQCIRSALAAGQLGFGFSAGGFLYAYHLGVLWELERLGVLRSGGGTLMAGASAGSLAIATYACGISREDTLAAMRSFAADCRAAGTRGRLTGLLREFLHSYLPDDAHERCRDVVHVSLSRLVLPYPRHEAISQFHDKADLIEALAASCHIPMYANGAWTTQFRGATYVDGGVTHFVPSPPSQTVVKVCCFPVGQLLDRLRPSLKNVPRATSITNIAVAPDAFEACEPSLTTLVNWALVPAEDEVLDWLVAKGSRDAYAWAKAMGVHELGSTQQQQQQQPPAPPQLVL